MIDDSGDLLVTRWQKALVKAAESISKDNESRKSVAADRVRDKERLLENQLQHKRNASNSLQKKVVELESAMPDNESIYYSTRENAIKERMVHALDIARLKDSASSLDTEIKVIQTRRSEKQATTAYLSSFKDLSGFPPNLRSLVFEFLPIHMFTRCISVCSVWKHALDIDILWKLATSKRFVNRKNDQRLLLERTDPVYNKFAIHLNFESGIQLTKTNVFGECMKQIQKTFGKSLGRQEELSAKVKPSQQQSATLGRKVRRLREEISGFVLEKTELENQIVVQKQEMRQLSMGISSLEVEAKSIENELSSFKRSIRVEKESLDETICELEMKIMTCEQDDEFIQLKRNRKALATEIKTLRLEHAKLRKSYK